MNKRQRKKQYKKELEAIEAERLFCQECGKTLDLKHNWYHRRWGTCDEICYMNLVGMSWNDFI
jgi:hypothetical protein